MAAKAFVHFSNRLREKLAVYCGLWVLVGMLAFTV